MKDMMIENFAMQNLQLTIDEDKKTAKCVRFTTRARFGYKVEFNFIYSSIERMYDHCAMYLRDLNEANRIKEERKIARAAARVTALETVKEGDIYVASWGWEQTNIDAYQVVAKKGATVTLREIGLESVEGSESYMSDRVRPVKDAFIGGEIKKRITGKHINIDDVRMASPVTESEKDFYRSWYA